MEVRGSREVAIASIVVQWRHELLNVAFALALYWTAVLALSKPLLATVFLLQLDLLTILEIGEYFVFYTTKVRLGKGYLNPYCL